MTNIDTNITPTTDMCLIKHIMCDNALFKASMTDEDIVAFEAGTWEPHNQCMYLNYADKAIIRVYPLSNISADIHVHLQSQYWGTGESEKVEKALEQWLLKNTQYCKLVIQTPQCCREVLKAATREGFQLEGILTAAISWRGKVENIVLMSKFIRSKVNE